MESRRIEAFRVLGIPADSDRVAVAHAYRRLALATHPDVSSDPLAAERFVTLTEAYKVAAEASPATAEHPAAAPRVGRLPVGLADLDDSWPEAWLGGSLTSDGDSNTSLRAAASADRGWAGVDPPPVAAACAEA